LRAFSFSLSRKGAEELPRLEVTEAEGAEVEANEEDEDEVDEVDEEDSNIADCALGGRLANSVSLSLSPLFSPITDPLLLPKNEEEEDVFSGTKEEGEADSTCGEEATGGEGEASVEVEVNEATSFEDEEASSGGEVGESRTDKR
jgi:hypothetical protein